MKKVTVSAPGKIHLSGEHAVVYGKPALILSTSLRTYVTLAPDTQAPAFTDIRKKDVFIDAILSVFEKKYDTKATGIGITIASQVPIGVGMGSSAALAVSLIGALLLWHGHPWNVQAINDLAYEAEKAKHGNSSGSDPAVATHGGIMWYRKELEFLKTLWLLSFKIPATFRPFVLINTGRVETTGDLVSHVATVKKKNEQKFAETLNAIEAVTKHMASAIHDEKEADFRSTLKQNHDLLIDLEIVSPQARDFIADIEKNGGVAKISGAGGKKKGSGVIVAMHDTPDILTSLAKARGYASFTVVLGGEGVKMEQVLV